jgi:FtsZ-interacting cell division protein ZipA
MSTLQIGLAIAGGVVLVGVVVHSTWTSRKNKPRQAQPLPQDAVDSSASTAPSLEHSQEPAFDAPVDKAYTPLVSEREPAPQSSQSGQFSEPTLDPVSDMARTMMQEATLHAQRVPDDAELARMAKAQVKTPPLAPVQPTRPNLAPMIDKVMAGGAATAMLQPEKRPNLDGLIDLIAAVEVDLPVSGEAAMAALPTTRRVGSKLFGVEGLNTQSGRWEAPRSGHRYSAFQTGVQLANRTGALNEIEFSEFVLKTQTFADGINGAPEFTDMLEVVGRARELDGFASAHDAQLSFTLKAVKAAWSPGYVHQNAARLGFVPGVIPGRMVVPAATAGLPPILGLTFDTQAAMSEDPAQSAIRVLTLSLDVPQVDRAEEPFARMIQTALELAREMDGAVTDDNGQPLSEPAVGAIARDLMALYNTLDARDLSAGSPQARRLFS